MSLIIRHDSVCCISNLTEVIRLCHSLSGISFIWNPFENYGQGESWPMKTPLTHAWLEWRDLKQNWKIILQRMIFRGIHLPRLEFLNLCDGPFNENFSLASNQERKKNMKNPRTRICSYLGYLSHWTTWDQKHSSVWGPPLCSDPVKHHFVLLWFRWKEHFTFSRLNIGGRAFS